jgi:hypothetical protein
MGELKEGHLHLSVIVTSIRGQPAAALNYEVDPPFLYSDERPTEARHTKIDDRRAMRQSNEHRKFCTVLHSFKCMPCQSTGFLYGPWLHSVVHLDLHLLAREWVTCPASTLCSVHLHACMHYDSHERILRDGC